ncbi:14 kDa phosphohistidine phosphatase-like isoform X1 [Hyposmocoma kahamanoa]|uniref:14 kDa phosphohistidine phosphatase-like isoform X1 n=1 Tax=Hyposmocoma kahamanoa TaxID=1477025 RepID=UPI000E6DA215|nr:14 kDa phosphohistidine phosphatase-like isoform X1 [Hyposmocoma kahamanoa]
MTDDEEYDRNCVCRDLESITKVGIDTDGEFKYILMKVKCSNKKHELPSVVIVRGYKRHNNHTDIFNEVNEELQPLCGDEVLGGGIITHDSNSKTINIFGKSDTYGEANHAATARLIREAYPDYKVTFNNK